MSHRLSEKFSTFAEAECKDSSPLYHALAQAMVGDLAKEMPETSLLCVYHTHVANQVSTEAKESLLMSLEKLGAKRDLIHVYNNMKPDLHLTAYRAGKVIDLPLAHTDGHARWIEWLPES
jgi:hypothetical protein